MKEYFIELNGVIVKSYKSKKRALTKAQEYATNTNNSVCIWCGLIVIWSNTEYQPPHGTKRMKMKTKAIYGIRITYKGVTTSGNVVLPTLRKAKALAKKRASEFPDWFLEVIERPLCDNGEYLSEDDGNIVATYNGQRLSAN